MVKVITFGCRINSFESEILKEKFKDYLPYIYAIAGILGGVLLIWVGIKIYKFFRFLFGWIPNKKENNKKE